MCYAGIRLLETFHLRGEQTKSHNDVIRHAVMPPRNFDNNNLSKKHPLGNDFIGEDDAGIGYTRWQVVPSPRVAMPNNITLLKSHFYYCIPTQYF